MKGFVDNIEDLTKDNSDFRRVLYTAKKIQLVLMALRPGEEIGEEVHHDGDQFFRHGGPGDGPETPSIPDTGQDASKNPTRFCLLSTIVNSASGTPRGRVSLPITIIGLSSESPHRLSPNSRILHCSKFPAINQTP